MKAPAGGHLPPRLRRLGAAETDEEKKPSPGRGWQGEALTGVGRCRSDLVPPLFRPRGATFPWGKVGGRLVAALRCFPFIRVFRGNVGCFPSSVRALGPDTFPGGEGFLPAGK